MTGRVAGSGNALSKATLSVALIGCWTWGAGLAVRRVARLAPAGEVMGIDLSTRMLELARAKSADEGIDNVSFVRGDAQVFPFEPDGFDIAMSSFGTMFFNDPSPLTRTSAADYARGRRSRCLPGGRFRRTTG